MVRTLRESVDKFDVLVAMSTDRFKMACQFDKVIKCIGSCVTTQQLDVCDNMINLYSKNYNHLRRRYIRFAKFIEYHEVFDIVMIAKNENNMHKMVADMKVNITEKQTGYIRTGSME